MSCLRVTVSRIECQTGASSSKASNVRKRSPPSGPVEVAIDNQMVASDALFVYKEDPVLENVDPMKSIVRLAFSG